MEPTLPAHSRSFSLQLSDAEGAPQRSVPLRKGLTLIGSRPGCRIRLRSSRVSPVHCAIVTTPDRAILRDLASETGTAVNDWEADDRVLSAGDRIHIRRWRFVVETAGAATDALDEHQDDASRSDARNDESLRPVPQQIELRNGNDESLLKSRRAVVLIGRHHRCDLMLHDRRVSRAHALLFHTGNTWAVADLLSANGTEVNDRNIDPRASNTGITPLADGDVLRVGSSSLTVHVGDPQELCDSLLESPGEGSGCLGGADTLTAPVPPADARPNHDTSVDALHRQAHTLQARSAELKRLAKELEEREAALRNRETDLEEQERSTRDRVTRLKRDEQYNAKLTGELETSTAELQERSADLDARYHEFESGRVELAERGRRADELRRELDRRQDEIAAEEEDLARRVAGAAKAIDICKRRSRELDARAARIEAGRENLRKERGALEAVARTLAQREEKAKQTEASLAGRERQLPGRENALVEHERGIERERESLATARAELGERERWAASEEERLAVRVRDLAGRDAALDERTNDLDRRERQSEQLKTRLRDLRSVMETIKGRKADAEARQAEIERREQALNERQEQLEQIARETTAKLDRLVRERQDLERRKRTLKEIEEDPAARELAPADRGSNPRASAVVMRDLPVTSDKLERPVGNGERLLHRREAELDAELKRLLARSVELRQRRSVPVSSE